MADPVYVALDFETADYQPDSACAVGLAKVRGGEVLFTWVHGITWKDVQDSPTFLEFWPQMASFLQGVTHLVAHNAPFDRRVLEACCQSNGIALPDLPFVCTLRESRRKLKLPSHKLDAVCRYCGIPLDHHHAGSDAIAAARILIYLQGESQGGE